MENSTLHATEIGVRCVFLNLSISTHPQRVDFDFRHVYFWLTCPGGQVEILEVFFYVIKRFITVLFFRQVELIIRAS